MTKPTITELMEEITSMAKQLEIDANSLITPNKIWHPTLGIITLWETQK